MNLSYILNKYNNLKIVFLGRDWLATKKLMMLLYLVVESSTKKAMLPSLPLTARLKLTRSIAVSLASISSVDCLSVVLLFKSILICLACLMRLKRKPLSRARKITLLVYVNLERFISMLHILNLNCILKKLSYTD
jgi:hypothetical protein